MWEFREMRMEHVFIWTGVFILVFAAVAGLCVIAYQKLKDRGDTEGETPNEAPKKNLDVYRVAIGFGAFFVVAVFVIALLYRTAFVEKVQSLF